MGPRECYLFLLVDVCLINKTLMHTPSAFLCIHAMPMIVSLSFTLGDRKIRGPSHHLRSHYACFGGRRFKKISISFLGLFSPFFVPLPKIITVNIGPKREPRHSLPDHIKRCSSFRFFPALLFPSDQNNNKNDFHSTRQLQAPTKRVQLYQQCPTTTE
jgi:hypothetical protein